MKPHRVTAALMGLSMVGGGALPGAAQQMLPAPQSSLDRAGRTVGESPPPHWPTPPQAPPGAPNVVVILLDDVGYGASSTFGGPVPTPNFDALAKDGLRFTQFHTTAICSATRAALLTGRNHNNVSVDSITELAEGYDGALSIIPQSAGTVAEILRQYGYGTAQFGKWHLTPAWEQSAEGPFDHWPNGMGFDYSYGFINGGETNQWAPSLVENRNFVEPPTNDPRYILDRDLADHAIRYLRQHESLAPNKPFFIYYAPGTAHAPHHAPAEWIAKFKGQFDQGWDRMRVETFERQKRLGVIPSGTDLTPRPSVIPAWDSLSPDRKMVYAHMMEVYAAALAHCDYQIGRVVDEIKREGKLNNTLIIEIMGDNGASSEGGLAGLFNEYSFVHGAVENFDEVKKRMNELGGPMAYGHYPVGWAWAMDTPFQWFKAIASHFGGTRNGMVLSWPAVVKDPGGFRTQFGHVIDVMPTVLEAAKIDPPVMLNGVQQMPIDGTSMIYAVKDKGAPTRHDTQYFDIIGNLALYHDGWIAATTPTVFPWDVARSKPLDFDKLHWELYDVTNDYSEAHDLSESNPGKLRQLRDLFIIEAARNHAFPVHYAAEGNGGNRPSLNAGRDSFSYYTGVTRIPSALAPNLANKSYTITAEVEVPEGGANGMLVTEGGRFGGYGLYLLNGRPVFYYNLADVSRTAIGGQDRVPAGRHTIVAHFKYDAQAQGFSFFGGGGGKGGTLTLTVDGARVAEGRIAQTMAAGFYEEGFDVGSDTGTPVSEDYKLPFTFTGKIDKLTIAYH